SLSFLGLGVQEPTAAWGLMLRGAAVEFAETAPWMAIFPGVAISLAVFAFNLFGDSLRDALDPRLASQCCSRRVAGPLPRHALQIAGPTNTGNVRRARTISGGPRCPM